MCGGAESFGTGSAPQKVAGMIPDVVSGNSTTLHTASGTLQSVSGVSHTSVAESLDKDARRGDGSHGRDEHKGDDDDNRSLARSVRTKPPVVAER